MRQIIYAGDVEILVDVEVCPGGVTWASEVPHLHLTDVSDRLAWHVDQAFEAAEGAARRAITMLLGD